MAATVGLEPPPEKHLFDDIAERLTDARTALAALGLLLYAVLRIAYSSFYAPFGLSPDELGLGYVDILAQSAIGAIVLLAAYALLAAALTLLLRARHDADAVRDGHPTRFTVLGVRLASWGGEASTLAWTTDKIDPALRGLAGPCLMYLGQANATLLLYSPSERRTFRVPAASAAVTLSPEGACPTA